MRRASRATSADTTNQAAGRRLAIASAALTAALLAMAAFSASALAVKVHPFVSSFKIPGKEPIGFGIAVNETTHHIYVTNVKSHQAFELNATGGNPVELTGALGVSAVGIAVDNSATASNGTIYVSGLSEGVQQFSSAGAATAVRIDATDVPANGTPQGGGLPNVVNSGSISAVGVAVDSSGNVLIADNANKVIDVFSSAGAFIKQLGGGTLPGSLNFIAVDSTGTIYVASSIGVYKLDSAGACINACAPINSERSVGVAVDAADNVVVTEGAEFSPEPKIGEYDSSGALISKTSADQLNGNEPSGIAVDKTNGKVLIANTRPLFQAKGLIFGPAITLPDAITEAPTGITGSSATLHGKAGADEGPPATCAFQYVTSATFLESGFEAAQSAPCSPAGPFTGSTLNPVEAALSGLNGGTTYKYRVFATSTVGSTPGAVFQVITSGPTIESQSASAVAESSAALEATINPHGAATTYRFEYVDQASFEASEYANATKVPLPDGAVGSGSSGVPVSQPIAGLAPGTAYHYRVIASNANGEATGPDLAFVTYPASGGLPDERAYEQVSPIAKNGSDVQGETNAIQVSPDGNRITFYANAGLAGGEGAQEFPSYLASREASSWGIQGLLPPASTGPIGLVRGWSEDLADTYVMSKQPTEESVFYDRASTDRSLLPIAKGGKERPGYSVAASTPDDNFVVFEHKVAALAPGATANKPNVYIWDKSTGKVATAGKLNNTDHAPTKGAFAGPYDWFVTGDTEAPGGAAASYYTQAEHVVSEDGSKVFFTAAGTGQLYMRVNPFAAQSPLTGEKCTEPETKACSIKISAPEIGVVDPNGEKPAAFLGATADGSKAFFLSSGKLTADANTGPGDEGRDLYRYDTATGDLVDLTPDPSDEAGAQVQGVLGMSADGSRVYFAANGVLAEGAKAGSCNLNQGTGACTIYLAEGAKTTVVARVEPGQNAVGTVQHDQFNWTPTSLPFNSESATEPAAARVAMDGKTLLFRSNSRVSAYDNQGFLEIYRYQVGDQKPTCVSCNPADAAPSGSAALADPAIKATGPHLSFAILARNLSSDGSRIFFETPDKLAEADTNGVTDVYEWEAAGVGTCGSSLQNGGCLQLISGGTSPLPSHFAGASASGEDAFFFTAQSLVYQDRDALVDVYDARVGGGIASQNKPDPLPCELESTCRRPATPPPLTAPPPTSTSGPGNPKPLKCKKGFKKVVKSGKERCVKVKHKQNKKQKKSRASKNRGARR